MLPDGVAFDILHGKVMGVAMSTDAQRGDNVRAVQLRGDTSFFVEAFDGLRRLTVTLCPRCSGRLTATLGLTKPSSARRMPSFARPWFRNRMSGRVNYIEGQNC